jgi:hypothetical protein
VAQLKLITNRAMPAIIGIIETMESGTISFQVICILQNLLTSPFLKNILLILPLPNAQIFP